MYLQHQSKVVRILRSLKGKCYSQNYLLQIHNFLLLSHFHYLLLFSSTLLSSIFCYFCCIIFLFCVIHVNSFLQIFSFSLTIYLCWIFFLNCCVSSLTRQFVPRSHTMFGSVFCCPSISLHMIVVTKYLKFSSHNSCWNISLNNIKEHLWDMNK